MNEREIAEFVKRNILLVICAVAVGVAIIFGIIAAIWSVSDQSWFALLQAFRIVAEIFAVAVAGTWALFLFWTQRQNEPAIGIEFDYKCISNGRCASNEAQLYVTSFDVTFRNIGKVRVQGRQKRDPAYPIEAGSDVDESLKYAGSLLLRRVPENLPENTLLDWFDQKSQTALEGFFKGSLVEADLLYDYAVRKKREDKEVTDFWMEPGEAYDVAVCVVLPAGTYFGIITFLGEKGDDQFWRRKVIFEVPRQEKTEEC